MLENYLADIGMEAQYITELYANFCYPGIAIFNFILGIIIAFIFSATYKNDGYSLLDF